MVPPGAIMAKLREDYKARLSMSANEPHRKTRDEGARRQEQVSSGAYKRQSEERLVLGGFAIILAVGGLLTALLLGTGPATLAVAVILMV